ncbi:MAG: MBL fold metallo-hydrolase, partial [Bacteroidota bacterium]
LCVVFLDVGQGDATFIQSPTGSQVLIDGGRDSAIMRTLSAQMSFWDRDLDLVVMTHPDADHVGGLIDVLRRYDVTSVLRTENESGTPAWEAVDELLDEFTGSISFARRGQMIDLGGGATLSVLFPDRSMVETESNTASIILQLTYGETSFLFTGDAPKSIEEYLVLLDGDHLESEVLKVGHHGSRTSTAELFLAEVSPEYAVISASADNQYGHPHVEVTDALFNAGTITWQTGVDGSVGFRSDGVVVTPLQ